MVTNQQRLKAIYYLTHESVGPFMYTSQRHTCLQLLMDGGVHDEQIAQWASHVKEDMFPEPPDAVQQVADVISRTNDDIAHLKQEVLEWRRKHDARAQQVATLASMANPAKLGNDFEIAKEAIQALKAALTKCEEQFQQYVLDIGNALHKSGIAINKSYVKAIEDFAGSLNLVRETRDKAIEQKQYAEECLLGHRKFVHELCELLDIDYSNRQVDILGTLKARLQSEDNFKSFAHVQLDEIRLLLKGEIGERHGTPAEHVQYLKTNRDSMREQLSERNKAYNDKCKELEDLKVAVSNAAMHLKQAAFKPSRRSGDDF